MLPPSGALSVSADGVLTITPVTSGTVPATAVVIDGIAASPAGILYVVYV
jgi:hypothetical protein